MLAILRDDVRPIPGWLANASAGDDLPLRELLRDSMFYPACGLDGRPVQYFGGADHSFVYVDESWSREDVTTSLDTFRGYRLLFTKPVEREALGIESFERHAIRLNKSRNFSTRSHPFFNYALWAVFERADGFDSDHGPDRFSLLYIGGEAVSAYWSLYWRHGVAPFAITLIKCDAFTGNWTSFRDDRAELATLFITSDWIKPPRYLFCDAASRESDSPWRWFSEKVTTILGEPNWGGAHHQYLSIWRFKLPPPSRELRERQLMGTARADLLDESLSSSKLHRARALRKRRNAGRRRSVNRLLERGINPLEAAFFKSRLTYGCLDFRCGTCGGRALRAFLEPLSRIEILEDLGNLDPEVIDRYEKEVRATLMYIDAGHLTQDEMTRLRPSGVLHVLYKMMAHHALRLENSRITALRERERYLKARDQRAELATDRLPNAIHRKDKRAVYAMIKRSANPDYVRHDGVTARIIAARVGVEDWLPPKVGFDERSKIRFRTTVK